MTQQTDTPTVEVSQRARPFMAGDPVVHRGKPFWNLGVIQSISEETGSITCNWWADHGFFQAASGSRDLRHAADVHRSLRADLRQSTPAVVEALGDALHGLSARMLVERAFETEAIHAAYERVVKAFTALDAAALQPQTPTDPQPEGVRGAVPRAWIFHGPNGEEELHSCDPCSDPPEGWTHTPLYDAAAIRQQAAQGDRA